MLYSNDASQGTVSFDSGAPNKSCDSGLSCVRTELDPAQIIPSLAHHPVRKSSRSEIFRRNPGTSETVFYEELSHQSRVAGSAIRKFKNGRNTIKPLNFAKADKGDP